ncbi:MAG: DUF1211 domain-containing protein [Planctomycetes bacterium]|nr:DUF1211 domain-containing protein [Planctomycetota bacterium]
MSTGQELRRRSDGFRERGHQVTRLEAFVDASFAFALTLLVISEDVPKSVDALAASLLAVPGLLCSFALIAMFWFAHNTWSRRYGLDDMGSIVWSLALVFLVMVYVYPLRMLFGSLFGWLTSVTLPRELLTDEQWRAVWGYEVHGYADIRTMFVVYGIAWSTAGLVIAQLYRRAWRSRSVIGLDFEEEVSTRAEIARWLVVPATGIVSVAVALAMPSDPSGIPEALTGAPGFVYFGMFATHPVTVWAAKRARVRYASEA